MRARLLAANLVDLALAAAIAALPAHLLALGWTASLEGAIDGPSTVTRLGLFVVVTAAVFILFRWTLERDGQGPGKCLWSLRVKDGKVVQDEEGLAPLERLGVFAGRFTRPLLLGLVSVLILALWGESLERHVVQTRQLELLRRGFILEAEHGCCYMTEAKGECPRMLEVWAAVADRSDGKGYVPPRDYLLEKCPAARKYSRR